MKKKFTVAVIGCGGRGWTYATLMNAKEEFDVVALCDLNPEQLEKVNGFIHLDKSCLFDDESEFFKEKRADILVISTNDAEHVRQAILAMEMGYDLLLEKPISNNREDIVKLLDTQEKTGRQVVVCHVMRYAAGIKKMDEILKTGMLGKLIAIDHTERVAYWHQAQAYVRFQKITPDKFPTILAKCSHDLDLIQHYAGARCETVSSLGKISHFRKENTPEGAADRCLDCKYVETCTYSAKKIYIDGWKKEGCPPFIWPYSKLSLKNPTTEADMYEALKTKVQGECAFKCGVEVNPYVVDHQMVQMQFENDVIASLKMVFAGKLGRLIALYGTEGEIVMDEFTDTLTVKPYGKEVEVMKISSIDGGGWAHGGGDAGLVDDLYDILTGVKTEYTSLRESVESHLMGIAAEESRLDGGKIVRVH